MRFWAVTYLSHGPNGVRKHRALCRTKRQAESVARTAREVAHPGDQDSVTVSTWTVPDIGKGELALWAVRLGIGWVRDGYSVAVPSLVAETLPIDLPSPGEPESVA